MCGWGDIFPSAEGSQLFVILPRRAETKMTARHKEAAPLLVKFIAP